MRRSQSSSADDELNSQLWNPSYPNLTRDELEALIQRAVRIIRQEQERIARNPKAHLQESIPINGYSQRLWLLYQEQGKGVLSLLVRHERVGLPWLFTDRWYKEAILEVLGRALPKQGSGRKTSRSGPQRFLDKQEANRQSGQRRRVRDVTQKLSEQIDAQEKRLLHSGHKKEKARKQAKEDILKEWANTTRSKNHRAILAEILKNQSAGSS